MSAIIKYPLGTEKSIRMMEAENKLVFVVDRKATKKQIKEAIENQFSVTVVAVNTHNTMKGKRAIVTFSQESPAIDLATKLGLM